MIDWLTSFTSDQQQIEVNNVSILVNFDGDIAIDHHSEVITDDINRTARDHCTTRDRRPANTLAQRVHGHGFRSFSYSRKRRTIRSTHRLLVRIPVGHLRSQGHGRGNIQLAGVLHDQIDSGENRRIQGSVTSRESDVARKCGTSGQSQALRNLEGWPFGFDQNQGKRSSWPWNIGPGITDDGLYLCGPSLLLADSDRHGRADQRCGSGNSATEALSADAGPHSEQTVDHCPTLVSVCSDKSVRNAQGQSDIPIVHSPKLFVVRPSHAHKQKGATGAAVYPWGYLNAFSVTEPTSVQVADCESVFDARYTLCEVIGITAAQR